MKNSLIKLIVILFLLSGPVISRAVTIESIAATVENRIITTGDVITESKILKINASENISLPVEGIFSRELLDQMINRELVFKEAVRAKFESGESDVVDNMLQFENKFRDPEEFPLFLKEEGLVLGDIVEWFHKRQVTMAYIDEKISLMTYVGPQELEEYYSENAEDFNNRPFEEVKNKIRALLIQKKGETFLDEWINDLRKRGNIKYLTLPPDQPLY